MQSLGSARLLRAVGRPGLAVPTDGLSKLARVLR